MSGRAGSSLVEALVALALVSIALAGLATSAAVGRRHLSLAWDLGAAVALAGDRLEALRAGPRDTGTDRPTGNRRTAFTRTWRSTDGRGGPSTFEVEVAWGGRRLELRSGAFP